MKKLKISWFSTGGGEASRQLLTAVHDEILTGRLNAEISFVFCNRGLGETEETDQFLALVRDYHLNLVYLSSKDFKSPGKYKPFSPEWRLEYDREVMKLLENFQPDICVLAGYMLIVSPEMCRRYRMINLHPAAPGGPQGTWQEVIWQLIESRAERTGVMMHLVTPELDKGPVVTYCTFSIRGKPFDRYWKKGENSRLFKEIRKHGLAREFPLIIATLKAFSQGKTIDSYDLTVKINAAIKDKI